MGAWVSPRKLILRDFEDSTELYRLQMFPNLALYPMERLGIMLLELNAFNYLSNMVEKNPDVLQLEPEPMERVHGHLSYVNHLVEI